MIAAIFFYIFAATAVVMALLVVSARNPIYSATALIGTLLAVAGIFALDSAHLMALLQILVYAGAIMVLILFVIMLLNLGTEARKRYTHGIVWSALASLLVLFNVIYFLKRGRVTGAEGDLTAFQVESVGHV